MSSENLEKMYITEIKPVNMLSLGRVAKKRGGGMKVSFNILLKTNREKMSVFRLSKMLLKQKEL